MPQFRLEDFSVEQYEALGYKLQPQKGMNMKHILSNTETTVSLLIRPQSDGRFSSIDMDIIDTMLRELQNTSVVTLLKKNESSSPDAVVYVMDTQSDIVELLCWIQKTLFSKFYQHVRVWALTYSTNKVLGDYSAAYSYKVSADIYRNVDVNSIDYFIDHNLIHYDAFMAQIAPQE